MHPALQQLKARTPVIVERDDLAIDDRLVRAGHRLGDLVRLRILRRAVEEVACLQAHDATVHVRDGPHAVPFRLVCEVGRVERLVRGDREQGGHRVAQHAQALDRLDARADGVHAPAAVVGPPPLGADVLGAAKPEPMPFVGHTGVLLGAWGPVPWLGVPVLGVAVLAVASLGLPGP